MHNQSNSTLEPQSLLHKLSLNRLVAGREVLSVMWLGLVLLLGTVLRFYDLSTESYWIDEMSTVIEGQQNLLHLMSSGRLDQPPAFYLPFHLWVKAFGTAEASTRSFAALAGMGSIVLIYLIGREFLGKAVGLLSAFLMAISEFQIYYSQNARFYSFFELTTLLSFLFFILALNRKGIVFFVFYAISSIVMLYSHTYGVFILIAQNIFFVLQLAKYRGLLVTWFACQVMILLAFLPYCYPLLFGDGGLQGAAATNSGGTSRPSISAPIRSVYRFLLPARRERSWEAILPVYVAAGGLLIAGVWANNRRNGKSNFLTSVRELSDTGSQLLLLACWLLSPIVVPFILSFLIAPMYTDRYTITAAPAFYVLAAWTLFGIRKVVPVGISLAALMIMVIPGLANYYVTDVHEQWREIAAYVEDNSGPDEVIVFAPNMGIGIQQKTFDWYYQGSLPGCGLPNRLTEPTAISRALMSCVSGNTRFWVIIPDYSFETSNPYRSFFLNSNQATIRLIKERQFVLISVYLVELTK